MKYIALIFLIYCFLKAYYYGLFEFNDKKNRSGGIAIIVLAIIGLIFPIIILFIYY